MDILGWVKSHPLETGGIVLAAGLAFIFLRGSGSSSSSSQDSGAAAYYAAESAQAQAGDALQAVQIESQAQTAQTQLNDATTLAVQQTWANKNLATTNANNAEATALAPYQTEQSLFSTLGSIASLPATTTTSTSSSSNGGFFGIGASSNTSTNTVVTPNPSAENADSLLQELLTNGFNAAS